MDYITREDLEAALGLGGEAGTSYSEAELEAACTAASRGIEQTCNRRFWEDEKDQTRKYRTDQDARLWIDDLTSLTELKVDGEARTEDTDFELSPLNAAADNEPYTSIRALGSRVRTGLSVTADVSNHGPVEVTGKFGWPEVPQQVVTATTILASRLLKRVRDAPYGALSLGMEGEAIATRIAKNDPEISFLLAPFVLPVI